MKKTVMALALLCTSTAFAQGNPPPTGSQPPAAPDMTKMGPMSRKVTKEDKKGVEAFFKAWEENWKKADVNALADMVDFPVTMMTDDSQGVFMTTQMTKDEWLKMMAPFMQPMPKDMKMSEKRTPVFLSDTWVQVTEDITMTQGKTKGSWHSVSMLVSKDGKWMLKGMGEAGWGDMAKQMNQQKPKS